MNSQVHPLKHNIDVLKARIMLSPGEKCLNHKGSDVVGEIDFMRCEIRFEDFSSLVFDDCGGISIENENSENSYMTSSEAKIRNRSNIV
jgi:hypothetical protein